jgi:hypothetical protein
VLSDVKHRALDKGVIHFFSLAGSVGCATRKQELETARLEPFVSWPGLVPTARGRRLQNKNAAEAAFPQSRPAR